MFRTVLSLLGLLVLGCTEFEPGTDELGGSESGADTSTNPLMPAAAGFDWSCIGTLQAEQTVTRSNVNPVRLVQSLQVLSLVAGTVPRGVTVRACAQRDVGCSAPLTQQIPLDAQGFADLPLYEGFDGYLEVTGPEIISTLLFYQAPLTAAARDSTALGVVETTVLPMLTAAIGTPQDPALGLVYLRAFDCQGAGAPEVSYTIDRPGIPWYFVAGLPSGAPEETDGSGLGGFINVTEGITVVDAAPAPGQKDLMLPKTVLVRPNWMTGLRILPALLPPDQRAPSASTVR